ncbi:hypothetical protein CI238_04169 [Colletotrichum incanum]|uniref:Uncharacterized protein n=1 Tax=Colletotrichum incanum TaxID=1573173 RepID=A0A167CI84_COLIC|nr:hypothetical protein CI238_04169 [Colletotrichum incanum]
MPAGGLELLRYSYMVFKSLHPVLFQSHHKIIKWTTFLPILAYFGVITVIGSHRSQYGHARCIYTLTSTMGGKAQSQEKVGNWFAALLKDFRNDCSSSSLHLVPERHRTWQTRNIPGKKDTGSSDKYGHQLVTIGGRGQSADRSGLPSKRRYSIKYNMAERDENSSEEQIIKPSESTHWSQNGGHDGSLTSKSSGQQRGIVVTTTNEVRPENRV